MYGTVTTALNIDEIRQRAQRPRRLVWVESELDKVDIDAVRYSPAVKPVPGAVTIWNEAQADMFSALPSMGQASKRDMEQQSADPAEQSSFNPWVGVNRFPDGSSVPRIRRDTLEFIQHGAQEAVESLFFDVASQTGLHWSEVRKQIEAAFNSYEQEREVYNVK